MYPHTRYTETWKCNQYVDQHLLHTSNLFSTINCMSTSHCSTSLQYYHQATLECIFIAWKSIIHHTNATILAILLYWMLFLAPLCDKLNCLRFSILLEGWYCAFVCPCNIVLWLRKVSFDHWTSYCANFAIRQYY